MSISINRSLGAFALPFFNTEMAKQLWWKSLLLAARIHLLKEAGI